MAELRDVMRARRERVDRGRIVEQGTHAELLRRKGAHARLWLLQQRIDQDQAPSGVPP